MQYFADQEYGGTEVPARVERNLATLRARYKPMHTLGDEPGDALGRAVVERRIPRAAFEKALQSGIASVPDAAPELVAFFASIDTMPAQLDLAAVARGATVFRQIPPVVGLVHNAISGFFYAAIYPNAALPLSMNKNMVNATHRRYIETAKYVADSLSKNGQDRYSEAFKTACRVRLVHTIVRTEIIKHYPWNFSAYGHPINVSATLMVSMVTGPWIIPYAEQRGLRFSQQEKNDLAMYAAYVAFLQGVPAEHLITTYDDCSDYIYLYLKDGNVPLPEDKEKAMSVMRSLVANGYPISANRTVTKLFNDFLLAEARRLFGDELSEAYEIPRPPLGVAVAPFAALLNRALGTMKRVPLTRPAYAWISESYWEKVVPAMLKRITGHAQVTYADAANAK